jgi:NhaP-type Na+/H+ or K+/H+ antiporter
MYKPALAARLRALSGYTSASALDSGGVLEEDAVPDLLLVFAVIAAVLMLAALLSGIVERVPVSFPMIFLGLGFLLGGQGLGLVNVTLHSPALETIAILSLSFVLFLDALHLRFGDMGREWVVPVLALGPGTLLTVGFIALLAALVLRLPPLEALLLGTILASLDPVVLRDVVRDERIPRAIRSALQTEAGTNDLVVLPLLLILATLAQGHSRDAAGWIVLSAQLFLLGPLAGIAVGLVAVWLMRPVQARITIDRAYLALYGVGTILAAYVVGEAVGGSGFLAVFAAGAVTVALDYDLCDCFLEYGETTSEMAMLLAFLLFGALLSSLLGEVALLPALLFALLVLVVARPLAIGVVLRHAPVSGRGRRFIGWFGPRGLSSLLFGLLVVTDGVPGAERLLALTGIVVIVSVFAHGVSAAPLAARYGRAVAGETLAEERESTAAGLFHQSPGDVPRITPRELAERLASANPPLVLDVRTRSSFAQDDTEIPGSVRVPPDRVADWATGQDHARSIVAYCT